MIVVDSNILVHFFLNGEHRNLLERVRSRDSEWVAPILWRSEFRNVCIKMNRFGNIPLPVLLKGMEEADDVMRASTFRVQSNHVIVIAHRYQLTAYDAEYLSLALELDCQVLTFEKAMISKCPDVIIHPYDWLASH